MKKFFAFLLLLTLLMPTKSLLADDEPISMLQALSNLSKSEDYKLVQSIFGNAEFEEGEDHLTAEYRITVSSTVANGTNSDSYNRVNANVKLINHNIPNDATPFKEMTAEANAEVIVKNQKDLYFRLNNLSLNLKEPLLFAVSDVENVKSMVFLYQDIWFHSVIGELTAESLDSQAGTPVDVDKYMGLEDQFEEDPKKAIMGLFEMLLKDTDTGLSEEEMTEVLEGVKLALETKLFTNRLMVAGQRSGFTFFTLNKTAVVNMLREFGQLIGEELTDEDIGMVRSALSKINFSGFYRMAENLSLIDNLLVRLKIKETGPMKRLELNYRYKVSDVNKENTISAPPDYEELNGIQDGIGSVQESLMGLIS